MSMETESRRAEQLTARVYLTKADTSLPETLRQVESDPPINLLRQSVRRLQIVILILLIITVVTWFGVNLVEGEIVHELQTPGDWVPPVTGIAVSLLLFAITRSKRLSPSAIINFGLAYEVGVCYFIAYGQYWNAFHDLSGERLTADLVGVSSVALWMAFFTVLVPARPRNALVALLLCASAVPVTVAYLVRTGNAPSVPPMNFFLIFVLPYLVTLSMCIVAAKVIYGLGRDVHRAEQMGSYKLLDLIGRGGMGEVWRARHNLLARPAAIKLIRRDALGADVGSQQTTLARFEREAQVTAGLESPNTVELYDFGVSEDGSLYYVMELLDGVNLDSLVTRFGALPPERTVHILRQACLSLGEAHRRGLIHRDIKPANIVLCEHAFEHDFVKVLDFGLVKSFSGLDPGSNRGVVLTHAEMVAGTPAFLAPEVATGKHTIDGRADLYSLGCVAFWLLTGRPVFAEETPVAMIVAHTNTPPPRPSERAEMPIPRELDDLVIACLAKLPSDRPETAELLACMLEAVPFKSPWTVDRAREWWATHRPHEAATDEGMDAGGIHS
jgi:serine/threonine-protein kinase